MAKESGQPSGKRLIRRGRRRVRKAFFMASISAIRSNPKVKDFYKHLRNEGKNVFVALTAVAHKLLIILNSKMRLFREGKQYF
jgi:transposase